MTMRARKGWRIITADGTAWDGDCPKWASLPLPEGARIIPIRIYGRSKWYCAGCAFGMH